MADEEDFSSDTDDENYVPSGEEAVSEDDQSGEDEGLPPADGAEGNRIKAKRKRNSQTFTARKRTGGIRLAEEDASDKCLSEGEEKRDDEDNDDEYNKELCEKVKAEQAAKREQEEKKKADALWADFMKDTTPAKSASTGQSKSVTSGLACKTSSAANSIRPTCTQKNKVTVTKEFDFAGETVRVNSEVNINSAAGKAEMKKCESNSATNAVAATSSLAARLSGVKKAAGGLGSVLGKIGQKPKMSTLEKSKLDWNAFKDSEGINEELQIHNRGKDGYMERQKFLLRTDQRQFEQERNLRLGTGKR